VEFITSIHFDTNRKISSLMSNPGTCIQPRTS